VIQIDQTGGDFLGALADFFYFSNRLIFHIEEHPNSGRSWHLV